MDIHKDYTARKNYTDLKTQRKAIERAYRKGRVSLNFYNSSVMDLDKRIQDCEAEIALSNASIIDPKVVDGHFVIELCCICGQRGNVTRGKMDFKLLGKDTDGFICFECPKCKKYLQYDPLTGAIKIRKPFLTSLMNPETAMELVGMFWLILIVWAPFYLFGGIIGGRSGAAFTDIVDSIIGTGMISVVGVLILSIRKSWQKHQKK